MDIPATAAIWLVIMAVIALGGALGGVAAVYFADKNLGGRPGKKYVARVDSGGAGERIEGAEREERYERAA